MDRTTGTSSLHYSYSTGINRVTFYLYEDESYLIMMGALPA